MRERGRNHGTATCKCQAGSSRRVQFGRSGGRTGSASRIDVQSAPEPTEPSESGQQGGKSQTEGSSLQNGQGAASLRGRTGSARVPCPFNASKFGHNLSSCQIACVRMQPTPNLAVPLFHSVILRVSPPFSRKIHGRTVWSICLVQEGARSIRLTIRKRRTKEAVVLQPDHRS